MRKFIAASMLTVSTSILSAPLLNQTVSNLSILTEDVNSAFSQVAKNTSAPENAGKYELGVEVTGLSTSEEYTGVLKSLHFKALQNDPKAQFWLAHEYDTGNNVKQDYKKALYWYKKSAKQAFVPALNNLGSMYFEGDGVKEDNDSAIFWLSQSARENCLDSQLKLGFIYKGVTGFKQDYSLSRYWFEKAANGGLAQAEYELGVIFFYGRGVVFDKEKAKKLFISSCEKGYKPSCVWSTS